MLIVDDDEFSLLFTRDILHTTGICCQTATAGSRALELIAERIEQYRNGKCPVIFDLILTDYSMPGMDGPKLIQAIRLIYDRGDIR